MLIPIVLLIGEDNLFTQTLIRRIGAHGVAILTARDDAELVAAFAKNAIDVVLLDSRNNGARLMPIMDQMSEPHARPEIILLTASEDVAASIEAMRRGADDEISIPIDIRSLTTKLEEAMQRRKRRTGASESTRAAANLGRSNNPDNNAQFEREVHLPARPSRQDCRRRNHLSDRASTRQTESDDEIAG